MVAKVFLDEACPITSESSDCPRTEIIIATEPHVLRVKCSKNLPSLIRALRSLHIFKQKPVRDEKLAYNMEQFC